MPKEGLAYTREFGGNLFYLAGVKNTAAEAENDKRIAHSKWHVRVIKFSKGFAEYIRPKK